MKFYGKVGFANLVTREDDTGVDEERIVERYYYGDVLSPGRQGQTETINQTIVVTNKISIVADAFAEEHFFAIRCVEWNGIKWYVTSANVERPRIVLTLGGAYHDYTS